MCLSYPDGGIISSARSRRNQVSPAPTRAMPKSLEKEKARFSGLSICG
jgi:hypothetical protein